MRALLVAVLLCACGDEPADRAVPTPEPEPRAGDSQEVELRAEVAPSPPGRDVGGLRVTVLPGGHIRIEGQDRWGGDVTTTYESVEYLERALPSLERSCTAEQIQGLRGIVAELRAGALIVLPRELTALVAHVQRERVEVVDRA